MKNLKDIITEKLKLDKNLKITTHKYFPETKEELRKIVEERLKEDKDADLNDIDVSKITNMGHNHYRSVGLFEYLDPHNIKIDKWNVSNVKDMNCIFWGCENFNSDLSNWDVSNVENMSVMFCDCKKFNSDLSDWDVSKVEDMTDMFNRCKKFNCDLSKWDVSNVKDMRGMFSDCNSLKNKPSWYKE